MTVRIVGPGVSGVLPGADFQLSKLTQFEVSSTAIGGSLPDTFGATGALPSLVGLRILNNTNIGGELPDVWGDGRFGSVLTDLVLDDQVRLLRCACMQLC